MSTVGGTCTKSSCVFSISRMFKGTMTMSDSSHVSDSVVTLHMAGVAPLVNIALDSFETTGATAAMKQKKVKKASDWHLNKYPILVIARVIYKAIDPFYEIIGAIWKAEPLHAAFTEHRMLLFSKYMSVGP